MKNSIIRRRLQKEIAIAALALSAQWAFSATQTNWISFNDHRPTEGVTHANATGYDMLTSGNGGVLKDINTGGNLPVILEIISTGAPDDFGANAYPDPGTPAFNLFDGKVDVGNGGIVGVRNSSGSSVTMMFRNLDPTRRYTVYGTAARGNNYVDRWAMYTLQGADSASAAHVDASTNKNLITLDTFPTATLTASQAALNSGENRVGSLVGWANIDPGSDGTFSIVNEQYFGPTPFGTASAGPYGYALDVIYLAEVEEVLPIRITQQPVAATNAPGQTATFSVTVQGVPATYRWQKAAPGSSTFADIAGATAASYTTAPVANADDASSYRVVVSGGGATITSRAVALNVQGAAIVVPGLLKMEVYRFIAGVTVADLTAAPNYPAAPDEVTYLSRFDTRTAFPADNNNNYGARITGFIVPVESGNYQFFLRSDDASELSLSTDENPANLVPIAAEDTCCGAFEETGAPETSAPKALVAGRRYAVQALLKEGGVGDYLQVAWRKEPATTPAADLQPIGAAFLASQLPAQGQIAITQQPANRTGAQNSTVDFSVSATSLRTPMLVQWQKNGVTIPGLVGSTVSFGPLAASDNNAEIRALVSVPGAFLLSDVAQLTVTNDSTAPSIVRATTDESLRTVTVEFSEAVAAASAGALANYSFDKGLTVASVQVLNPSTVRLTTGAQTEGTVYTLTVQNVLDTAGNAVAANSTVSLTSFANQTGGLKFEAYNEITGTPIDNLKTNSKYPARPDLVGYVTSLNTRGIYPDDTHDNYGARMSGWLVPTDSGDYHFFLRSDDAGELWLSTDNTPANLVKIAEELDCCGAFMEPEIGDPATSLPVTLVAGRKYYLEVLYKEGGGGDYAQVAWRKVGDTNAAANLPPIPGSFLQVTAPPGSLIAPTLAFTSPAADTVLPTGSDVVLVAQAVAGGGKSITKVEFFRGAINLGVVTNAPYSVVVSNLVDDVFTFTARATDTAGLTVTAGPLRVYLGEKRETRGLVAIDDNSIWRFNREGLDLGTAWREKIFDDSGWQQGKTLIADESPVGTVEPIRTAISRLTDAGDYIKTMYFRFKFNWTGSTNGVRLSLRHVIDDGAVVYLNGREIHRFGIASGPVDFLSDAASHEQAYAGPFPISPEFLDQGENVLAVEVHQNGGSSSDIVFGAELIATVPLGGTPEFTRIQRNGQNIILEWTNGGTLQSRASLSTGSWEDILQAQSPYQTPNSSGPLFFRIRR